MFCCLRHALGRLPRYERVRQFVGKQSGTDDVRDWDVARVCASKAAARGLLEGGARSSASARSVAVLHLRAHARRRSAGDDRVSGAVRCGAVQGNCRWISSTQHCVTRPALVSATEYTEWYPRGTRWHYDGTRWYTVIPARTIVAWRGVAWA